MVWLADDACIMAAVRQHESDVSFGQLVDLIDRAPWRHVIIFGSHNEERRANVLNCDGFALDHIAAGGEIVMEEELRQIFRMHAIGKARGVGIPGH